MVDLGGEYSISSVVVYARTGPYSMYLANIFIQFIINTIDMYRCIYNKIFLQSIITRLYLFAYISRQYKIIAIKFIWSSEQY